jgi:hypothetical protein
MIYLGSGALDTEKPFALFDNGFARANLAGSSPAAAGCEVANIIGPQTFDYWQPASPAYNIFGVLPAPETFDTICVAAHNLSTHGGDLYFTTSPDLASAYTSVFTLSAATLAANGPDAIAYLFAPRTVQRFYFYSPGAVAIAPQIGVAMLGLRTVFPGWVQPPYVQMPDAETLDLQTASSLGGHYIDGSVRRKALAQDVQFSPLARSFVDGGLRTFGKYYNSGAPFFWGSSPLNMPGDIGYVWRSGGELRPALMDGGQYASVKMGLAGYDA